MAANSSTFLVGAYFSQSSITSFITSDSFSLPSFSVNQGHGSIISFLASISYPYTLLIPDYSKANGVAEVIKRWSLPDGSGASFKPAESNDITNQPAIHR